jgi:hypothetical protein
MENGGGVPRRKREAGDKNLGQIGKTRGNHGLVQRLQEVPLFFGTVKF